MTDQPTHDQWARAVAAAGPELDAEGQRIAVQTYWLLARGKPVPVSLIAAAAGVGDLRAEESLRSWPLVFWDDQDRVIGFWGLAIQRLDPTHALEVNGETLYGWCAWDTLFISEILGTETRVRSVDPNDGTEIELSVGPDGVLKRRPSEVVVSLLLPEGDFGPDTIQRFCHLIHFFSSVDSALQWIGEQPGIFAVGVDEAFELGKQTNQLRLGGLFRDHNRAGR
ncbi:MAG: organomercurial lyase [Acidimicrobiia bacterium]